MQEVIESDARTPREKIESFGHRSDALVKRTGKAGNLGKAVWWGRKREVPNSSNLISVRTTFESASHSLIPSSSTATMAPHHEEHYHPKDAIAASMKTTMLTGGAGLFASAVQNTLTRQNVGPLGVFIRSGGTVGIFGMNAIVDAWAICLGFSRLLTIFASSRHGRYLRIREDRIRKPS